MSSDKKSPNKNFMGCLTLFENFSFPTFVPRRIRIRIRHLFDAISCFGSITSYAIGTCPIIWRIGPFVSHNDLVITARVAKRAKVMFSQAFVCSTWRGEV